jgi:hypothetical protein
VSTGAATQAVRSSFFFSSHLKQWHASWPQLIGSEKIGPVLSDLILVLPIWV